MHRRSRQLFAVLLVPALCAGALLVSRARAAEDRPASQPFEIEDPPPADPPVDREGKILVAVVDTGVDADHPALKGRVLPAINLSGAGGGSGDEAGHGTALAGLICAQDDNPDYDGVCSAIDAIRILPIKVTPGSDSTTLPSRVAAGIDRAVDEGCRVICVGLGGPRSSEALEAAMAKAEKSGVLVIAPAGVDGGFHDLYPAAHPWAVSCTTMDIAAYENDGGELVAAQVIASHANRSGKTELLEGGYSKALSPGGGYQSLQGSSVPCGKAAGWAAWLISRHPELAGGVIRGLLTGTGPCLPAPGEHLSTGARRMVPDALRLAGNLELESKSDLCLEFAEWKPLAAEGRTSVVALVRNLAGVEAPCKLRLLIPSLKRTEESAEVRIPAGSAHSLSVEFAAVEGKQVICDVEVACAVDPNPSNNSLRTLSLPTRADLRPYITRLSARRAMADGESVELSFQVSNPAPREWEGVLVLASPKVDVKSPLLLKPHESRWIQGSVEMPTIPEGKLVVQMGVRLEDTGGGAVAEELYFQKVAPATYRTQYADVYDRKEVVVDAPATLASGRTVVPVCLFLPEILTLATETFIWQKDGERMYRNSAGIMVNRLSLEQISEERVQGYRPDLLDVPIPESGNRLILAAIADGNTSSPAQRLELPFGPVVFEDWSGAEAKTPIVGWCAEDAWHQIILVPKAALEVGGSPAPHHVYLRCVVNYATLPTAPRLAQALPGGRIGVKYVDWTEVILRIALDVTPPTLHATGHYYDTHVHSAVEFSRNAVEPRLAWGGPPWMIARSAHAMGFIDDKELSLIRLSVSGSTRIHDTNDRRSWFEREPIVTTDHNCFLTDEHVPLAKPWSAEAPGTPEIAMLRRYFGAGAGQELSMRVDPERVVGAAHGLIFGVEPLAGPWHGGRSIGEYLKAAKILGEAAPWISLILELVPRNEIRPGISPEERLARGLKHLRSARHSENRAVRKLYDEIVDEGFRRLRGKCAAGTREYVESLIDSWAEMDESDLKALRDELAAFAEELEGMPQVNPWGITNVEDRVRDIGSYIAAHPCSVGDQLHWDEFSLRQAANLVGSTPPGRFQDRFPFRGMQIFNEPMYFHAEVTPAELRSLNPWAAGRLHPDERWHVAWMQGLHSYLDLMVKPGLTFQFREPNEDPEVFRPAFPRKVFHHAGSDAHGAFNFTTGVGATVLTHPRLSHLMKVFGFGHGGGLGTSHYGAARVYCAEPRLEEFLSGRCVCTDGPILWPTLDADLKFDSRSLTWHESRLFPNQATDDDGAMGGGGVFDGRGTTLVRRGCPHMIVRYRVAGAPGLGGDVELMEAYAAFESEQWLRMAPSGGGVDAPVPVSSWRPGLGDGQQFSDLPVAPTEPGVLLFGAFTGDANADAAAAGGKDLRYDVEERRALSNPIWISTVDIRATIRPVLVDGKAVVPPFHAQVQFLSDHSMLDRAYPVLLKQFNRQGDSVARTIPLVPLPEIFDLKSLPSPQSVWESLSKPVTFWRDGHREIRGRTVAIADRHLIATNLTAFELSEPCFPIEGVVTFAVILGRPCDTHGNPLNPVAGKVEVRVPKGSTLTPEPDSGASGDTSSKGKPEVTPTGQSVLVTVTPGERIQLPRGAAHGKDSIPPGTWTVPEAVSTTPLDLIVWVAAQPFPVTLVASGSNEATAARPAQKGWAGRSAAAGDGEVSVWIRNDRARTLVEATPIVTTKDCVAWGAPEAEAGPWVVSVRRGSTEAKDRYEAVIAVLSWDFSDAKVGEPRTLRVELVGASDPAAWKASGEVRLANAQVAELSAGVTATGDVLRFEELPAGPLGIFRPLREGEMTATGNVRAVRKP